MVLIQDMDVRLTLFGLAAVANRYPYESKEPLAERTQKQYGRVLLDLTGEKGSLLRVTQDDILTFLESMQPRLSDRSVAIAGAAIREFFRFAEAEGLRPTNPAPPPVAYPAAKKRRPVRRWATLPRREALQEKYRPHFDFLREVWGRNPELTWDDLESINVSGRVPEMVEIREGKRRGQYIALSPRAQRALQQMGGRLHRRVIQREFQNVYGAAFDPTDLKDLPPVGFGVELHSALEGEVRDLLTAGNMEDAARKAFVIIEERLRALSGRDDLRTRNLVDYVLGDSGALAAVSQRKREPLRTFLSGAMGLLRNELAHRSSTFPDEAHGLEVILVADFVMRLLDDVERRSP